MLDATRTITEWTTMPLTRQLRLVLGRIQSWYANTFLFFAGWLGFPSHCRRPSPIAEYERKRNELNAYARGWKISPVSEWQQNADSEHCWKLIPVSLSKETSKETKRRPIWLSDNNFGFIVHNMGRNKTERDQNRGRDWEETKLAKRLIVFLVVCSVLQILARHW